MPIRNACSAAVLCTFFVTPWCTDAQTTGDLAAGLTPYQSFHGGDIDSINLENGNLVFQIPLASYPQRGALTIGFHLVVNTKGTHTVKQCTPNNNCTYFWVTSAPGVAEDEGVTIANQLYKPPNSTTTFSEFAVVTSDGAQHPVAKQITGDATGFWTDTESNAVNPPLPTVIIDRNGVRTNLLSGAAGVLREDPNGNQILIGSNGSLTDTMGRVFPFLTPGQGSIPGSSTTDFSGCTGPLPIASASSWSLPTLSGGTMILKFCQVSVPINIPAQRPAPAFSGTQTATQSMVLPNGTAWTFAYDNYGLPSQITLPTGGTIAYTYTTVNQSCGNTQTLSRNVTSRTVNANDGTGPHTWQYGYVTLVTTVSDPLGNDTVHTFTNVDGTSNCYAFETQTHFYQGSSGSGTLLETTQTDYNVLNGGNPVYRSPGVVTIRVTTTWPNGEVKKVETDYDSNGPGGLPYGDVIAEREYDYGSGSPGTLLRTSTPNYLAFSNSSYLANNLVSLRSSVQVTDSSGTQRALTTYGYDEAALASSGVTTQHDSAPPTGTARGNLTSVSRWLNTTGGSVVNHITYFDTGMVNTKTDANNNRTTVGYSSTFIGTYPTTVTNALGHVTTTNYDFNSGLILSTQDPNNFVTSFGYDSMWRLDSVNYPDRGQTAHCYTDTGGSTCSQAPPPFKVMTTKKMSSSQNFVSTTVFDGLGRVSQTQLNSDPDCGSGDKTDTAYDAIGRVHSVSNPYCTTSDPTYGLTTYTDDALGRSTQVANQDNSTILTSYTGRSAQVQDESNGTQRVTRISQVDGLGRITSVCEVSTASLIGSGGSPVACGQDIGGTGFLTTYGYDTLDNLTSVSQSGLNSRTFQYDSLSRLTSVSNPESSTITYNYDADGNVISKTDARGITTCLGDWTGSTCNGATGYDALNRLLKKTYSDGTPSAIFNYDQTSSLGVTLTNTIGRKSSESTAGSLPTGSVFSYDSMGRIVDNSQCTPQNCGTSIFAIQYPQHDFLGNLVSGTNAAGVTFSYSYSTAGRLTGLSSNFIDPSHPGTLFSQATYNAPGLLKSILLGNNLTEIRNYNPRLQLTSLAAGTVYSLSMGSYAPNGDVLAANDSVNGNWTYTYDAFNRLLTASATGQSYTYDYDRFGNRWHQNGPNSSQLAFDANNHITSVSGISYDASGNLISDGSGTGSHKYFYDAENRIIQVDGTLGNCSAAAACYVYDAEGRRVRKTTASGTLDFLYDTLGHKVAEVDITGTFQRGELYADGRHFAVFAPEPGPNGATFFTHGDWLGTERARTDMTGAACETITSLPFGDAQTITGNCNNSSGDVSPMHFTGKERDTESNLDYFGNRFNSSRFGRFMTPDNPRYSDKADPQTWNLYSYVSNNPVARIDPAGRNWFHIHNGWEWHPGDSYRYNDSKGHQHTATSNYTHLLVIHKTGHLNKQGAAEVSITLYGNSDPAKSKPLAQAYGFTGGPGVSPAPNGSYEINLNNHGGVETNKEIPTASGYVLAPWHDGIQEVGSYVTVPGLPGHFNPQQDWGSLRANLSKNGVGTNYYLHGKGLYFTEGRAYTAGCVCDPYLDVLKPIFSLNPSGVGEGDKNGRIAVSIETAPK